MRKRGVRLVLCLVVLELLIGSSLPGASADPGITTRVSVDSSGGQANASADTSAISANGRFVAFSSLASNLVPGDTNGVDDVFVHDRGTGTTTRVSVDSAGRQKQKLRPGARDLSDVAISADGRFVVFVSEAQNLVLGDTNQRGVSDVFVHDRQTAATTRVSVSSTGAQANGSSFFPAISADGRFVAFSSWAGNLVPGDTNETIDVFLHDRQTRTTTRVSVDSAGRQAKADSFDRPSISADGRFVAFGSRAPNLVPADTNETSDVFVHDRQTGATSRVSVSTTGIQGNDVSFSPTISGDGRFVTFTSVASNLVPGDTNGTYDVFVHDRQTGATTRVSVSSAGVEGDGGFSGHISADGRFVTFTSFASNLVAGDTNNAADVFVHDRQTGATIRVSVNNAGVQADGTSGGFCCNLRLSTISADGRFVAFGSVASNLVPGDTNGVTDIFIHGPIAW